MNLAELVEFLGATPVGPAFAPDTHVGRVVYDARKASLDSVFAALPGTRVDGHDYLTQASIAGAIAALVQRDRDLKNLPLPGLAVDDTRQAMGLVAARLAGDPSGKLKLIGVTGTNGKTTTTSLVRTLLEAHGTPTGLLGTLGAFYGKRVLTTGMTTPLAPELQGLLADLVESGAGAVAMEVSSHAIHQARVYGCAFETVVFTNLTPDHLDYHVTMEEYGRVKQILFDASATGQAPRHAVVNLDDPLGRAIQQSAAAPVIGYGLDAAHSPTLLATDVVTSTGGCTFTLHYQGRTYPATVPLPGRFNVSNALAALGVGLTMGLELGAMLKTLASAPGVPGRAEVVSPPGHPFTVWVDYAHTPDGIENVLSAARALSPRRLIVVFGCGGDRDRAKRPLMGEAAGRLADLSVVTSDNPRSEDPTLIIQEIVPGIKGDYKVVEDREQAIAAALKAAGPGDLVVIAGKGHETTQTFADHTIHFDDREVAREQLSSLKA